MSPSGLHRHMYICTNWGEPVCMCNTYMQHKLSEKTHTEHIHSFLFVKTTFCTRVGILNVTVVVFRRMVHMFSSHLVDLWGNC